MVAQSAAHREMYSQASGSPVIIVAGATGDLGRRICHYLIHSGATVRALVRRETAQETIASLQTAGVHMVQVDFNNIPELAKACAGGTCLVSALSGLREVIVDVQNNLLQAAIAANVPRFIPSDYCIDFTKLPRGSNRNLDLRRDFYHIIEKAPIRATSILNGMFTDLLTGQAPVVLSGLKRVLYWGNPQQLLDFTTTDNTAAYTALAALDNNTPRFLRIAGEESSAEGLRDSATAATGKDFKLLRAGGLGGLQTMINITRKLFPKEKEVFPPWQGMQYLHNMFSGGPKLHPLDNHRYPGIRWTSVAEMLATNPK